MLAAILFDLDGTLFDTAQDLAAALNLLLTKHGRPTLTVKQIKPYAAQGSPALLKLGFGINQKHPDYEKLRQELFDNYDHSPVHHTRIFDDMAHLLHIVELKNIPWGIVTNKPKHFTSRLLEHFGLTTRAQVVICPEDIQHAKPSPEGILLATKKLGVKPNDCLYIGDQKTDVDAAKAAGMPVIVYLSGYHHPETNPKDWHADFYAENRKQILEIIERSYRPVS